MPLRSETPTLAAGAPSPGAAVSSRVLLLATLSLSLSRQQLQGSLHALSAASQVGSGHAGPCLGHSEEHPAVSSLCLAGPFLLLLLFSFSRSVLNPPSVFTDCRAGISMLEWACRALHVGVHSSINELGCLSRKFPASPELEKNIQSPRQPLLRELPLKASANWNENVFPTESGSALVWCEPQH